MNIDGFSMHRLIAELAIALVGGRIDRITQPGKHTLQITIRQPGENHTLFLSMNPQSPTMYRLEKPLENPPVPPTFCMALRKQLETGRIAAIRQHGMDRIVSIDIDCLAAGGRIVTRTLIAELIGKYSNLILVEDGTIVTALRRIGANHSRVRQILPGGAYLPPPGEEKHSLFNAPMDAIRATLRACRATDKKLAAALSATLEGFGPITAKEIAFCAGLSANVAVATLDDSDFGALENALQELCETAQSSTTRPCLYVDKTRKLRAMAAFPLHYLPADCIEETFPDMETMLRRADRFMASYTPPAKEQLQKLVHMELSRAKNKIAKLQIEIEAAEKAEDARVLADNLMTYQYQLQDRACAECRVPNIYDESGAEITIPLDQRLTVSQNVQAYYHKYNKLKRAQSLVREQIDVCEENIRYLETVETSLAASATLAELGEIRAELIAGGWLKDPSKKKIPKEQPSRPFRFYAPDGTEILVGKNNYQNDRLTCKIAARDDLWLHTKDIPGSHVILRSSNPSEETLRLAASLAVHFSQATGSSNVPVDYIPVRYLKKPSGAKPGFVIFTNQKTLYVTPDEDALAAVLRKDANADGATTPQKRSDAL